MNQYHGEKSMIIFPSIENPPIIPSYFILSPTSPRAYVHTRVGKIQNENSVLESKQEEIGAWFCRKCS